MSLFFLRNGKKGSPLLSFTSIHLSSPFPRLIFCQRPFLPASEDQLPIVFTAGYAQSLPILLVK